MKTIIQISLIIFLVLGCKKLIYYPDVIMDIQDTQFIAHRGGRTSLQRENTLIGIKAALKLNEGVEIDVQISKDESIWLSHSEIVKGCNTTLKCFPETRDLEIRGIMTCNGLDISYTQLDSVFKYLADSCPNKIICIDLKGWIPCSGNSLDIEGMMRRESEIIINLANLYGITKNVFFEIEPTTVLDYIKSKKTNVKTYVISYGHFEREMLIALKQGYSGISYKNNIGEVLTKEKIDLIHRKGLKIIVWNLNSKDEIKELKEIGVDYIQMDL